MLYTDTEIKNVKIKEMKNRHKRTKNFCKVCFDAEYNKRDV